MPYIDAQKVSPNSGVWLTGIGLYHKGSIGYGGFVGWSVQTLDFSNHLIPSKNLENGQNNGALRNSKLILDEDQKYDFSVHRRNL